MVLLHEWVFSNIYIKSDKCKPGFLLYSTENKNFHGYFITFQTEFYLKAHIGQGKKMIMERCFTVLFYNTVRTPERMTNDHNNCISKHTDNQSSLQINQYGFPRELAVSKARKTADGFRPVYQMYSLNITYLLYPSFRSICYGSLMGFPLNNQRDAGPYFPECCPMCLCRML